MHHRIFALLLIVSPLVMWTSLPYPYSFPRWIYLATLCVFWAAAITYDVWKKNVLLSFGKIDYAFFAFVSILGLATVFSVDPWNSLWGSMERGFGFALWPELVIAYLGLKIVFTEKKSNKIIWRGLICTILVASLWGIAQKIFPGFSPTFSGGRIGGTLGNAIFFGAYLSLAIGTLSFFIVSKFDNKIWRIAAGVATALAFLVLLFTQTRGPLLGLIAGTIISLFSIAITISDIRKRKFITSGIAALTICATLLGIWSFQHQYISTTTVSTRFINWKMASQGFLDKPLLGWGVGQYTRAADKHFDPTLSEYSIDETHADKPHNYFVELAVTSGALGLLSYLLLLGVAIISAFGIYQSGNFSRLQLSILLGIITTSVVQNFTAFETHGSVLLFVFILALIAAHEKNRVSKKSELVSKYVTLTMCIASSFIAFFGTWIPIVYASEINTVFATEGSYANQHSAMEQLHTQLFSTAFQRDYFTAISYATLKNYWQQPAAFEQLSADEKIMQRADMTRLNEDGSKLAIEYSKNSTWTLALANNAFEMFVITHDNLLAATAEKLFAQSNDDALNRQESLVQLAQLFVTENKMDEAIKTLTSAIALDPHFAIPIWNRGLALFIAHQPQKAWIDISNAITLGVQKPNEQIAQYIYTQLLNAKMETEASQFERYFDGT